jgi:hypothetical protein
MRLVEGTISTDCAGETDKSKSSVCCRQNNSHTNVAGPILVLCVGVGIAKESFEKEKDQKFSLAQASFFVECKKPCGPLRIFRFYCPTVGCAASRLS